MFAQFIVGSLGLVAGIVLLVTGPIIGHKLYYQCADGVSAGYIIAGAILFVGCLACLIWTTKNLDRKRK